MPSARVVGIFKAASGFGTIYIGLLVHHLLTLLQDSPLIEVIDLRVGKSKMG